MHHPVCFSKAYISATGIYSISQNFVLLGFDKYLGKTLGTLLSG